MPRWALPEAFAFLQFVISNFRAFVILVEHLVDCANHLN